MHVLLPPSETKRDGGDAPFDPSVLTFPELAPLRQELRSAVAELSKDPAAASAALKLGPRQAAEIERNARLTEPDLPAMAAMDRFTGVLFEALDAPRLASPARAHLAGSVLIHSALWGLVGAADAIPAYRLSHDSRIPGLALKRYWARAISAVLADLPGLLIDLRSDAYAGLGPLPVREDAWVIRLRTRTPEGRLRSLNHFNKQGKGRFVRALAEDLADPSSVAELADWSRERGYELSESSEKPRELDLVMPEV